MEKNIIIILAVVLCLLISSSIVSSIGISFKIAKDKEAADKEAADKEAADKEAADKEAADKDAALAKSVELKAVEKTSTKTVEVTSSNQPAGLAAVPIVPISPILITGPKPRQTITDFGYPDAPGNLQKGWYDIQKQGIANDYCSYIGPDTSPTSWHCALAGETGYSNADPSTSIAPKTPLAPLAPKTQEISNQPAGLAIKCLNYTPKGDGAIYRYDGNNHMRHYPNPEIADSWDKNWGSPTTIDCSGFTLDADIQKNPKAQGPPAVVSPPQQKPWNNCVVWGETDGGKHDDWCRNDLGQEWHHTGQDGAGCPKGQGKGICSNR